jgi:hypothetical protein
MLFTIWTCEDSTQIHYNIAECIVIFQCGLHLCQQYSSTLGQEHVLPPSKRCSPSSASHWHMAFCSACHWYNGVLTGFFFNDQAVDILMVQGEDCRVDTAYCLSKIL